MLPREERILTGTADIIPRTEVISVDLLLGPRTERHPGQDALEIVPRTLK